MSAMDFINELLLSFALFVNTLFQFEFVPGVSLGGILVALAVFSLFFSIFISRMKR